MICLHTSVNMHRAVSCMRFETSLLDFKISERFTTLQVLLCFFFIEVNFIVLDLEQEKK